MKGEGEKLSPRWAHSKAAPGQEHQSSLLSQHLALQQFILEFTVLGISVPGFTAWPSCDSREFCSEEANLCIFMKIIVYGKDTKRRS